GQRAGMAGRTPRTADRRQAAGDIGVLDATIAAAALARARSAAEAQAAGLTAARGAVRVALGMRADEPLAIAGDLRDRERFTLAELLARAPERPDLRALAAEAEQASADARLGRGMRWPKVGLGATYERDDGNNVALGTMSLSLPLFERGQVLRAEAGARERGARLALEASRRTVSVEVQTAFE